MSKLTGRSGRIKVSTAATISNAVHAAGVVTITVDSTTNLRAGGFVLISGVVGMTDLNNDGKGHLVTEITDSTTFKIALTTAQTYTSGGSAQRIIPITSWSATRALPFAEMPDSESGDWTEREFAGLKSMDGNYEAVFWDGQDLDLLFGYELTCELDIDENNYYSGSFLFDGDDVSVDRVGSTGTAIRGTFKSNGEITFTSNL